ncbi:hypothetical protein D3C76_1355200 [compost metagenome]
MLVSTSQFRQNNIVYGFAIDHAAAIHKDDLYGRLPDHMAADDDIIRSVKKCRQVMLIHSKRFSLLLALLGCCFDRHGQEPPCLFCV